MGYHGARNVYLETIHNMIKQGEDIVLVSSDLAAPCLDEFRTNYHKRYVSVGIAEQNLISIACGIALSGKRVIAYAANPFPVLRGFDQIRNGVSLMNIPLSIVGVGTGFSIPEYGATHYNIEDISLIRTCPNMKIITVSDEIMAEKVAYYTLNSTKPSYIRFDKMVYGKIYSDNGNDFNFDKGYHVLSDGNDIAIITNGYFSKAIFEQKDKFEEVGLSVKLIDIYGIPVDKAALVQELYNIKGIVSVEEHVLQGGLGSMILEILADIIMIKPMKRIGLNFEDGYPKTYGSREYLLKINGLDIENIILQTITFKAEIDVFLKREENGK
jgi:transketolase